MKLRCVRRRIREKSRGVTKEIRQLSNRWQRYEPCRLQCIRKSAPSRPRNWYGACKVYGNKNSGKREGAKTCLKSKQAPENLMPVSFRRSSIWFARSAAEACWNFNAMADAAGTGWLNGSGQTQNSWDPPLKSLNSKLIVTICNSEQNGVTPASACFLG